MRIRLLMPTLVLMTTITAVVSSLGAPLVPEIATARDVSLGAAQWTLTAAVLMGAVTTPLIGRLGGFKRRRQVLLGALGLVAVGLLVAALPLGFEWLLLGRGLQGVGLGLAPLAIAVAREAVPKAERPAAIALLSVSTVAGAGLGFPITALVGEKLGLPAAYWLGFAVTVATLALVAAVVPASEVVDDAPVDWFGALLLACGSGGLLLALSWGPTWGWLSRQTLILAGLSMVTAVLWGLRSLRTRHPLVDLRLARRRGIVGANVAAVLAGTGIYLMISLVMVLSQAPQSTGYGLGMSLTQAGLLLVPYALSSVLGNRLTRMLGNRLPLDLVLPLGSSIYLLSALTLAIWHDHAWQLFVVMGVAGLGSGCTFAAMPGLIVRFVPLAETGSAMAFNLVLRYLGFSAGSALAPVLLAVFSPTDTPTPRAFTGALLASAGLWLVTALGTLILARRVKASPLL